MGGCCCKVPLDAVTSMVWGTGEWLFQHRNHEHKHMAHNAVS